MATTGFIKNFVVKNGITTGNITLDASSGNITGTNLSVTGNSDLGAIANVHITGGTTGQAIITDGSGNLAFGNVSVEADPAPMPTYVAVGNTVTISANYQGIFGYPITVDGTIVVDGILVDVNDATVPAGNINYVQYNAGNIMGGDANFYYTAINGTMTLQNETIIGNSTIGNLVISSTANLGSVSNVRIIGGSSGQYLQTDGTGNLSWAAGGGGGSGSPGGVNTQVQFNDAGAFAGNTGFTFNKTTGIFTASYVAGTLTTAAQPNITSVGTLTSLTVNGNISANNANITGNIIPTSNNTYSLGSASSYWKDAYIGPGSLYINGVKVLEESSNAIVISADLNQTVKVTSSGSGDVQLQTTGTGVIAVKGPLQIQAANYITSSTGGPIGFSNPINVDTLSSLSANTNLTISANGTGNIQLNDDVTIAGNLTVTGVGGNLSVTSLTVEDNIIDISAETTGVPVNNAGIRVIRGDDPAVQIRWNESSDTWQTTNDGSIYLNIVGSNTTTGNANVGNIGATSGIFTTVAGSLTTNAQPNITSVGSLSGLTVSNATGIVNFTTTANVTLGAVANLHITGGTNAYVLSTDGSGNLSWVAQSGGGSGSSISNGDSNVNIATANGNITFSAIGNANVMTITGTGANINGTANITGNVALSGANVSLGSVGNLKITGGNANYVLQTDGLGNLSWTAQTGGSGGTGSNIVVDTFTGNGVQTVFTLTNSPTSEDYTLINIDGVSQLHSAYTVANANVTLSSAPANGASIEVMTFNISGAGGNGTSGYTYVEATGNTAASVNTKYIVNTNTANLTITLPSTPSFGDEVGIIDGTGNASVHAITVGRNGGNIQGAASDMTVTTDRSAFTLVYYNASQGWVLTNV